MFEELNQHRAAVAEQIQKACEIGFTGGELEKAHKVGDIHPNGKWVWTQLPSGRYDWRVIKKTGGGSAPAAPATAQKKEISVDEALEKFLTSQEDADYNEALVQNLPEHIKDLENIAIQRAEKKGYKVKQHPNSVTKNSDIQQQALKEKEETKKETSKTGRQIYNKFSFKTQEKLRSIFEEQSKESGEDEDTIKNIEDYIKSGDFYESEDIAQEYHLSLKDSDKLVKFLLKLEVDRLKRVISGEDKKLQSHDRVCVDNMKEALTTFNSKYTDLSKVKVHKTPKGNWDVSYDGHRLGILGKEYLYDSTAEKMGWLEKDSKEGDKGSKKEIGDEEKSSFKKKHSFDSVKQMTRSMNVYLQNKVDIQPFVKILGETVHDKGPGGSNYRCIRTGSGVYGDSSCKSIAYLQQDGSGDFLQFKKKPTEKQLDECSKLLKEKLWAEGYKVEPKFYVREYNPYYQVKDTYGIGISVTVNEKDFKASNKQ